jgi:hypothetical protein
MPGDTKEQDRHQPSSDQAEDGAFFGDKDKLLGTPSYAASGSPFMRRFEMDR